MVANASGSEPNQLGVGPPKKAQHHVHQPVLRIHHPVPQQRQRVAGHDRGRIEQRAPEPQRLHLLVEQQGEEERRADAQAHRENYVAQGNRQRGEEVGILGEHLDEVAEADPLRRVEDVELEEAQHQAVPGRVDHECRQSDDPRKDEEVAFDLLLGRAFHEKKKRCPESRSVRNLVPGTSSLTRYYDSRSSWANPAACLLPTLGDQARHLLVGVRGRILGRLRVDEQFLHLGLECLRHLADVRELGGAACCRGHAFRRRGVASPSYPRCVADAPAALR